MGDSVAARRGAKAYPRLRRMALDLGDRRLGGRIVAAIAALYAIGFGIFYPNAITNRDESNYLRQALALSEARVLVAQTDPLTGEETVAPPSTLPIGTALLMAPFVAAGGWRAAYLAPLLELLLSLALIALWLREAGRSPLFALFALGFLPLAVLCRVPNSDVPSLLMTSLGLWLFWRGRDGSLSLWLGAGWVAGASLLFRETNPLVFAPLFAGAVLRRDPHAWALLVGGLAGVALRVAANSLIHGDPFWTSARSL